jgi:hypothetical protein
MAGSGTRELAELLEQRRTNAVLAWLLVAFLGLVVVESALTGDLLWAAFAGTVVTLAVLPAVAHRDSRKMLPWEVLALGALPVVGRATATVVLTSELATHLSVAALALVVAVELEVFTPVRMPPWFAVLFVVIATMATAGVLAVARWVSDLTLGTTFLLLPDRSEAAVHAAVMGDFVAATAAGVLAGVVFEWYFRRRVGGERRYAEGSPEGVE